jgi:glucuronate isomerase
LTKHYLDIYGALDEMPIIDTHEHFLPPSFFADGENTLFRLIKKSYIGGDFFSAGMPCILADG